jgi:hypothetical protein
MKKQIVHDLFLSGIVSEGSFTVRWPRLPVRHERMVERHTFVQGAPARGSYKDVDFGRIVSVALRATSTPSLKRSSGD